MLIDSTTVLNLGILVYEKNCFIIFIFNMLKMYISTSLKYIDFIYFSFFYYYYTFQEIYDHMYGSYFCLSYFFFKVALF